MKANFEKDLREIQKALKKWHPKANTSMVEEAFYLAKKAHKGQKRKSGKPYFTHPLAAAKMLAERGLDEVVVTSGLLHDVIEDTDISRKEIEKLFGKEVYTLIEGVTKLQKFSFNDAQEYSTATTIKTIIAGSKNLRVFIIKIFDKLHNMRTIKYLSKEKQKRIAADVLTIYIPIIHKLGMHEVKYEMEDIAYEILEPKKYKDLKRRVDKKRSLKRKEIKKAISILKKKYPKTKLGFQEKQKSIYAFHTKMISQGKGLEEINDCLIMKILVPNMDDCYSAIGKLHETFAPIPSKLKDFIAIPEAGIYQSIHLQVIGPGMNPLKAYIFTKEMEDIANNGIIFYLRDREKHKEFLKKFRKLFQSENNVPINNQKDLINSMQLDFHNNTMVVFTTKGKIVSLPEESTVLDFSFFCDEKKARKSSVAQVNGKIVPLWKQLNAGDRVKILYSNSSYVNANWMSFVNSYKAKQLIEKNIIIKQKTRKIEKAIKFRIESIDRIGMLKDQSAIMAKNGLSIKTGLCKIYDDNATSYTEFFVSPTKASSLQKAIKQLKELKETLNVTVDYPK